MHKYPPVLDRPMRKPVRRSACDNILRHVCACGRLFAQAPLKELPLDVSVEQTGLGCSTAGVKRGGEDPAFPNCTQKLQPARPHPQEGKPEAQEIPFPLRGGGRALKSQNSHQRVFPVLKLHKVYTCCLLPVSTGVCHRLSAL